MCFVFFPLDPHRMIILWKMRILLLILKLKSSFWSILNHQWYVSDTLHSAVGFMFRWGRLNNSNNNIHAFTALLHCETYPDYCRMHRLYWKCYAGPTRWLFIPWLVSPTAPTQLSPNSLSCQPKTVGSTHAGFTWDWKLTWPTDATHF